MANDACYYDNFTKECTDPNSNQVFSCDVNGLSATACIQMTFSDTVSNTCHFVNGVCE